MRKITQEKEDTLNQIQSWGVNAFVSQQLQDLRDALQAVHAERDDALEQLKTANHVKKEMAAQLLELGASNFQQSLHVPARAEVLQESLHVPAQADVEAAEFNAMDI